MQLQENEHHPTPDDLTDRFLLAGPSLDSDLVPIDTNIVVTPVGNAVNGFRPVIHDLQGIKTILFEPTF